MALHLAYVTAEGQDCADLATSIHRRDVVVIFQQNEEASVASNYEAIREENLVRYGTDIARTGRMLLADRYDDRTHFIFELLQNAETALGRRGDWTGQRKVSFMLENEVLTLSHFGKPFDGADVRGVCGIGESTADQFAIGRFGIGFKSVYTFTDCPEIHSGHEHFAIRNYVQPTSADPRNRETDETLIVLPLKTDDKTAAQEIVEGFRRLGPSALLFLRSIEEISWAQHGGASGVYLRSPLERLGEGVHRINLIGLETGEKEVDQDWLVFHRDVSPPEGEKVGRVELAFSLTEPKDRSSKWSIQPVSASPLVVFFPTVVETNFGFMVQGPYRTTPSRDNVSRSDPWNIHLVNVTAELVVEALCWMRDQSTLDASTLGCLPLERTKFVESSMFAPVFDAVRNALLEKELLPRFDGGYVAASKAKLARTQEVRELFAPEQVAQLFGDETSAWLSSEITLDRNPALRKYLIGELGVAEVTPATLIPRLTGSFLESQSDEWILKLYEFLNGQEAALRGRLYTVPLIRLSNGVHVAAREGTKPSAFLPSTIETDLPTIRQAVCSTEDAKKFLKSLGITEPDPVDDVIWNVLPKYQKSSLTLEEGEYGRDIDRIRIAYGSDSKSQREKLVAALRETDFLMVYDAKDGKKYRGRPSNVYLATERLKSLFDGVPNVLIVDDGYDCLRGEAMRELLESCNAVRYPRPVSAPNSLSHNELAELRRDAGHAQTSGINDRTEDWDLYGFEGLLKMLPRLPIEKRADRARMLWESLGDLEERRGRGVFVGEYRWTHHGSYKKDFWAAFVRRLTSTAWIPDENGDLKRPHLVVFEELGWKPNAFLLSVIAFKPPILDQLAKEAGIDPAALALLKKLGITSLEQLTIRLGVEEQPDEVSIEEPQSPIPSELDAETGDVYGGAADLYGDDMPEIPDGTPDPEAGDHIGGRSSQGGGSGGRSGDKLGANGKGVNNSGMLNADGLASKTGSGRSAQSGRSEQGTRSPGGHVGRPFVSYVATHPDDEGDDPDSLDQELRMALEAKAIDEIIKFEPYLKRTVEGNKGFDLYEADASGKPLKWVEVKSMTGCLIDRPVTMSQAQFSLAQAKGDAFWLYVVEYAAEPERTRILRINDPAGHAKYFTFDHGWAAVAHESLVRSKAYVESFDDSVIE